MAAQSDPRLDELFDRLHEAREAGEIERIERAIWGLWGRSGDAALDRMLRDAAAAMAAGRFTSAVAVFNIVIEAKPDFAEAWNKRATLHYLSGDRAASLADIARTLALEPRHFGALSGLGLIHLALDNLEQALEAFEAALAVHPHITSAMRYVAQIKPLLEGPES